MSNKKISPIMVTDKEAIQLIRTRAETERRSLGNAAAITIIESLSPKHKQQKFDAQLGILPQKQ